MKRLTIILQVVIVISILAACTTSTSPQPTAIPSTEALSPTAAPSGPVEGGKLVFHLFGDPDTLDPARCLGGACYQVLMFTGASLITVDPQTGEFSPYLAESWEIAPDGLSIDFKLRQDVKFHNGTPLTAHDYAWTVQYILDPETASPTAGVILRGLAGAEALDDYTLRLNLALPNYPLLQNLTHPVYLQPLSKAYYEQVGPDEFSRHPIGVGPFVFKEYSTGEQIVLERNPEFTWGPPHTHGGPPYLETIEMPIIPEYSTVLAGLEAGEIDYAVIQSADLDRIQQSGDYEILRDLAAGALHSLILNVSKPPFDDENVRKAVNLVVDRNTLVRILENGNGEVMWGPISSSVYGYWPGVEEVGYGYDLESAKSLMTQAGYTLGPDGFLQKGGQTLAVKLTAFPDSAQRAAVLQQQFAALGIKVEIEQKEPTIAISDVVSGDFDLYDGGYGWPDTSVLFAMFHSSMLGTLNQSQTDDAELNALLETMYFTLDKQTNLDAAAEAQRYVIEKAYVIPLYAPYNLIAVSNDIQGLVYAPLDWTEVFDAYRMEK